MRRHLLFAHSFSYSLAAAFVLALLSAPAHSADCTLADEELVVTSTWSAGEDADGKPITFTEYMYESDRVDILQGMNLSADAALMELRRKVAAKSETNAMVLLNRHVTALKAKDPKSPDVANGTLVLEHQAGQVFQMSCAESLVLAQLLARFTSRQVEVNYMIFASADKIRLYFALPDRRPTKRLTLRSELGAKHLASGELEPFDLRIIGYSQGFGFGEETLTGGELMPQHLDLPVLKDLATRYNAHIAITNGFESMSFDSYELSIMTCPHCTAP